MHGLYRVWNGAYTASAGLSLSYVGLSCDLHGNWHGDCAVALLLGFISVGLAKFGGYRLTSGSSKYNWSGDILSVRRILNTAEVEDSRDETCGDESNNLK